MGGVPSAAWRAARLLGALAAVVSLAGGAIWGLGQKQTLASAATDSVTELFGGFRTELSGGDRTTQKPRSDVSDPKKYSSSYVKMGYCEGDRIGLGKHDSGKGMTSLHECAIQARDNSKCAVQRADGQAYFDALHRDDGTFQCKCPTTTDRCIVPDGRGTQPWQSRWKIYRVNK